MDNFIGVKIALLCGGGVLVYVRDDKPGLRFAGLWDLPGGGREDSETPLECITRELMEECRFKLPPESIIFTKFLPSLHDPDLTSCFMVARLSEAKLQTMQFGAEGNRWHLMPIQEYLDHPKGVAPLQDRFRKYLAGTL